MKTFAVLLALILLAVGCEPTRKPTETTSSGSFREESTVNNSARQTNNTELNNQQLSNSVPKYPTHTYTYEDLKLTFSYPKWWGLLGSTERIEYNDGYCEYHNRFGPNYMISLCAVSITNPPECWVGEGTCFDPVAEEAERRAIESTPVGADCPPEQKNYWVNGQACKVVTLDDGVKAKQYYGSRPSSKIYVVYHEDYRVAFGIDIQQLCDDRAFPEESNDCIDAVITKNEAADKTWLLEINYFDEMVQSLRFL